MKKKIGVGIHTKECYVCHRVIDPTKDNFIKLITYNLGEILEEVWFHVGKRDDTNCWGRFNQEQINNQLGKMTNVGMRLLKNMGMN